jgi:hypothetical protein
MKTYEDGTHSTANGDGNCIEKFSQPHPHVNWMTLKRKLNEKSMRVV